MPVGPLVPGASVERIADLTNTGSVGIGELQLAVTGTDTGTPSDGVQVTIDRCSDAWTVAGPVFTCTGTATPIAADRPLTGIVGLAGSPAFATGAVDHLRFTFRLPDSSPPTDQNTAGSVLLVATGNHGPGIHR